ncbi:MAG TPA: ATP-grasp domain-containing protein [Candidatus Hydrogenedentes bacterium]|nr:ATP-grasp domain-containing protein [Candidatus Hydrogenedentota bacterium]
MAARRITAAVIGVGGNVSQGIVKALRRSSLDCRIIGLDLSADQAGLYFCDAGWITPRAEDPAFLPRLEQICRAESVDIILTGCEPVLDVLADRRQEVEQRTGALFPVAPPETYWTVRDKWTLSEWMRGQGLPTAQAALSEDRQALDRLRADCGFPLLAKPRRGGGSRGLLVLQDEADLDYVARKSRYVVEEMLRPAGGEYTVGCFSDRNGNPVEMILLRRELHLGTTYRAWVDDDPAVRDMATRICEALRIPGPCNLQLLLSDRGPVCFEINPRFSGTTAIRAAFGFNDVETLVRERVLGEPPRLPRIREGIALRYWNELYPAPDPRKALNELGRFNESNGAERGHIGSEGISS